MLRRHAARRCPAAPAASPTPLLTRLGLDQPPSAWHSRRRSRRRRCRGGCGRRTAQQQAFTRAAPPSGQRRERRPPPARTGPQKAGGRAPPACARCARGVAHVQYTPSLPLARKDEKKLQRHCALHIPEGAGGAFGEKKRKKRGCEGRRSRRLQRGGGAPLVSHHAQRARGAGAAARKRGRGAAGTAELPVPPSPFPLFTLPVRAHSHPLSPPSHIRQRWP